MPLGLRLTSSMPLGACEAQHPHTQASKLTGSSSSRPPWVYTISLGPVRTVPRGSSCVREVQRAELLEAIEETKRPGRSRAWTGSRRASSWQGLKWRVLVIGSRADTDTDARRTEQTLQEEVDWADKVQPLPKKSLVGDMASC